MMRKTAQRKVWETPISPINVLSLESCSFTSLLEVTVAEQIRDETRHYHPGLIYKFIWARILAFKIVDEMNGPPWNFFLYKDEPYSHTAELINSEWISDLKVGNDLIDVHYPKLRHFVISTSDYFVEVLSEEEPQITMA